MRLLEGRDLHHIPLCQFVMRVLACALVQLFIQCMYVDSLSVLYHWVIVCRPYSVANPVRQALSQIHMYHSFHSMIWNHLRHHPSQSNSLECTCTAGRQHRQQVSHYCHMTVTWPSLEGTPENAPPPPPWERSTARRGDGSPLNRPQMITPSMRKQTACTASTQ